VSFTLNIVEHELEPFGRVVRTFDGNPVLGEVRHYLNAATAEGPATLYVCDNEIDVLAAHQAGCYAVYVGPDAEEPVEGAVLSVLEGEAASVVFDALLDIARRYSDWERSMDFLRLTDGSLQDLLDVSEPFLRNNVVVLDPALKLLAYTKNVPCDDPITVALIEHGYHTDENVRKFKLHKRFKPWAESDGFVINDTHAICKYVTVARSFKSRSSFSIISVMMCNVADPDPYLLDIYEMFIARIGYYAERDYPDNKPSGSVVDTFLKDLLSGGVVDAGAIMERSQYVGIPHDARFCLFYIKAGEHSMPSSRLLSDVSLSVAPAKTIIFDDAVVVLCFNCQNSKCAKHCLAAEACPHNKRTVSHRLNDLLERYDLTCGRSSKFTGLWHTRVAYEQARQAYLISRDKSIVANDPVQRRIWSRIFSFDAYAMTYLVRKMTDDEASMLHLTYAGAILDEMVEQDKASKTNNYEFLYAYLVHERRLTVVAEKLHMHRNNVSYRINRIEKQFGIDTNDPKLRQDLLLAYAIRNDIMQGAQ